VTDDPGNAIVLGRHFVSSLQGRPAAIGAPSSTVPTGEASRAESTSFNRHNCINLFIFLLIFQDVRNPYNTCITL
jgi:hypothetical protein